MSPRRAAWIIHFPAAYQSCARNDLTGGNAGVDKPTHRTEGNGNWKTAILVLVGPAVLPCHGRGCGNPVSGVVMPFVGGVFILKGWLGNKWLLFRYSIGMCAGWADNMAAHTVPGFAQRDFCQGCHNPGKGQEPGSRGRSGSGAGAPWLPPQLPLSCPLARPGYPNRVVSHAPGILGRGGVVVLWLRKGGMDAGRRLRMPPQGARCLLRKSGARRVPRRQASGYGYRGTRRGRRPRRRPAMQLQ